MNKRIVWISISLGLILLVIGLFFGWLDLTGRLPWQSGNLYKDPQGRFTMSIDPTWEQMETDGSYAAYRVLNPAMHMYMLALKASTVEDAFSQNDLMYLLRYPWN